MEYINLDQNRTRSENGLIRSFPFFHLDFYHQKVYSDDVNLT